MRKLVVFILTALLCISIFPFSDLVSIGYALNTDVEWNRAFGGEKSDSGNSVVQTADGGFLIAGQTTSFGAGGSDGWLIKTNAQGTMEWNKTFGESGTDHFNWVVQTSDGGFASTGYSVPSRGYGGFDLWLVKTDANGNMLWNKTYGREGDDAGQCLVQTGDGGYIISGYTYSYGAGQSDLWLVKTDANGNMLWNKTYGGEFREGGNSLVQTGDGGYVIAGSIAFDIYGMKSDVWLLKTDAYGNELWNKTFSSTNFVDVAMCLVESASGGFAITGRSNYDLWVIRTDDDGNQLWNKTFGGTESDRGDSIVEASDGGFVVVGFTESYGAGSGDAWLIEFDAYGNYVLNATYGDYWDDRGSSVIETSDGGYVIVDTTSSYGPTGGSNVWLIKLGPTVIPEFSSLLMLLSLIITTAVSTIFFKRPRTFRKPNSKPT